MAMSGDDLIARANPAVAEEPTAPDSLDELVMLIQAIVDERIAQHEQSEHP